MSLKRYENEIAVALLFFVAFGAFLFQSYRHERLSDLTVKKTETLRTLEETMILKRTWGDRERIKQAVSSLHAYMTNKRSTWRQSGTKVDVAYEKLSGKELNRVLSKWFSFPLRIEKVSSVKGAEGYRLEVVAKW